MGKKKRKAAQTATAGLGGAAAGVSEVIAKELLKELVSDSTKEAIKRWVGRKPKHQDDVAYRILRKLRKRPAVPVAELPGLAKAGLIETIDAITALRRVKMVDYCDGRRSVRLTSLGRDGLKVLKQSPNDEDDQSTGGAAPQNGALARTKRASQTT